MPKRPWINKQVSVSDALLLSNLIFNILIFNPKAVCSPSYRILKREAIKSTKCFGSGRWHSLPQVTGDSGCLGIFVF